MSSRWYGCRTDTNIKLSMPSKFWCIQFHNPAPPSGEVFWIFVSPSIPLHGAVWCLLVTVLRYFFGLKKLSDWWARRASIVHTPHSPYVIAYLLNVCHVAGDVSLTSSCLWQKPSWHDFFIHFPIFSFHFIDSVSFIDSDGGAGLQNWMPKKNYHRS